jgi:hypothetical protein
MKSSRILTLFLCAILWGERGYAQRYLSDLDSSLFVKDTLRPFLKKFENIRFTGYFQSQFQVAQSKGAKSFEGGDFSAFASNRFMIRRARLRVDYLMTDKSGKWAKALFTFQFDATERGVNVRDMFVRLYDGRHHIFSATTGLFARPFGYEVNLSSAFREAPERGRMSQILMPTERDLGFMVSLDPQDRNHKLGFLKIDAGLFNGQGLSGTTDFDSHKDFISRLTIKPVKLGQWEISNGLSLLMGGWRQATKYVYTLSDHTAAKNFQVDSSLANIGKISPRNYYGADLQLKLHHGWGATEWRGEYWRGKQPGTASSTVNPGTLPQVPVYRRNFDGAFFCFLQNIINEKHQLIVKYDWYDPNTKIRDKEIGSTGTNFSSADLRFSTLGLGYLFYMNDHVKLLAYYAIVKNQSTQLAGYEKDIKDNVLTFRLHFRF